MHEPIGYAETAFASLARTATPTPVELKNQSCRGMVVVLDVTAVTATPALSVVLEGKDEVSGKFYSLLGSVVAVAIVGTTAYTIYPGVTVAAGLTASTTIPRTIRIGVTHGDSDSATYTVGVNFLV